MVNRWVLTDNVDVETYTFPRNPFTMSRGLRAPRSRQRSTPTGVGERITTLATPVVPFEWSFSGTGTTDDFYNTLKTWATKQHLVVLTDHFLDDYNILLFSFEPDGGVRPSQRRPNKFRYTMKALVFGEAA